VVTTAVRAETERLALQVGALQSRLVQAATYATIQEAEFKVFSQNGEDGIIQYLLSKIPIGTASFVEVGVQDYVESNTRFLLMNNYWHGLIIDCGVVHVDYIQHQKFGWQYDIRAVSAFVTRENINEVVQRAGFTGDLGLFSLDIDGNDYWVLDALEVVSPRIVIVEYNSVFGPSVAVTVPYDPVFDRSRVHYSNLYYGASLSALAHLMQSRGYALVGSNRAGNNAFFVRRDALGDIRETSPAECYVPSPFAESRDRSGALTYVRSMSARLELIGHLPVYDVLQDSVVPLKALT